MRRLVSGLRYVAGRLAAFRRRSWVRPLLFGFLLLGAAGLVVFVVWGLPGILTRHPHIPNASDQHKAISDTRTGLIAAVVAAGAAGGLAYTARTYRLSREGQFTDRYSKAVEQLGDDKKLEVRLGGIYALERLMADSSRDQPTILEVLAAWVRERTTCLTPEPERFPTDVQAVLTVIGRRTPVRTERPIDLRQALLANADLAGAHLEGAFLAGAHLDRANLEGANLTAAYLGWAHLEEARLGGAHSKALSSSGPTSKAPTSSGHTSKAPT